MADSAKSLFELVVDPDDLHPFFDAIRTQPVSEPTRWMIDDVFQSFRDPDGNFVEQFQSSGFNARFFELYLFAYFHRSGFRVMRDHVSPDFLVSRDGITAAVESTTVNPSTSGVLAELGKTVGELSGGELIEYQRHELPIRFGSPLFSKLNQRYWELPHCRDLPLVLAVEAFHDEDALGFGDSSLTSYLYGVVHDAEWDTQGTLTIDFDQIYSHVIGEKEIPSFFFGQPDTENVSAVLFTNAGTSAKFTRMGYQCGVGTETIDIRRVGYCFNEDPDARDPTFFSYNLDDAPLVEPWGQGIVVLHNPNCLHPLPMDFFPDAIQGVLDAGRPRMFYQAWHPFSSKTLIVCLGDIKKTLAENLPRRIPRTAIGAITKEEFRAVCAFPEPPIIVEDGWFTDESQAFLGVVTRDKVDNDWGFVVLARDQFFDYRAIEFEVSLPSRDKARVKLQQSMAALVSRPQRIFPQSQ